MINQLIVIEEALGRYWYFMFDWWRTWSRNGDKIRQFSVKPGFDLDVI